MHLRVEVDSKAERALQRAGCIFPLSHETAPLATPAPALTSPTAITHRSWPIQRYQYESISIIVAMAQILRRVCAPKHRFVPSLVAWQRRARSVRNIGHQRRGAAYADTPFMHVVCKASAVRHCCCCKVRVARCRCMHICTPGAAPPPPHTSTFIHGIVRRKRLVSE